jgi:hypothetical protein
MKPALLMERRDGTCHMEDGSHHVHVERPTRPEFWLVCDDVHHVEQRTIPFAHLDLNDE